MNKRVLVFLLILTALSVSAQQYLPYRRGDLWGLVERGPGAGIVSPKYTSMKPLGNGYFNVSNKDSNFIILDSTGKETINLPYAPVTFTGDGLLQYPDKTNGDTWYHVSGRKLNFDKQEVKQAEMSHDGRLVYKNHAGKKGYLDVYGNVVIKAVYDNAYFFFNGYAVVGNKGKIGAIDSSGNIVIPLQYSWVRPLKEDRFIVYRNDKGALADKTHHILTAFHYKYIDDFSEGIACVTRNDRRYINTQGKELWPKGFPAASGFENDIAIVNNGKNYMLMNTRGEIIFQLPGRYDLKTSFHGIFFVPRDIKTDKYMVMDRTGKTLYTGMSRLPYDATRSYCVVVKDGYYGTINEIGKVIIPLVYEKMSYIRELDAWYVEKDGRPGYVDHLGTQYWIGE